MIELLVTLSVLAGADFSPSSTASSAFDQQQHPRVYRGARDYRIQVYRSFRMDREEFDRVRAAGGDVLRAWNAAGRSPQDRDAVVRWFDEATRATASGGSRLLPAIPAFFGPSAGQPAPIAAPDAVSSDTPDQSPINGQPVTDFAAPASSDVIRGFDLTGGFDEATSTGEADGTIEMNIVSPTNPPSANKSSPLETLRRAILKATSSFSKGADFEFDDLTSDSVPDWPTDEPTEEPAETP